MKFKIIFFLIIFLINNRILSTELIQVGALCGLNTNPNCSEECKKVKNDKGELKKWLHGTATGNFNKETFNRFYKLNSMYPYDRAKNICSTDAINQALKEAYAEGKTGTEADTVAFQKVNQNPSFYINACLCADTCATDKCQSYKDCGNNEICKLFDKTGDCPEVKLCQLCPSNTFKVNDQCLAQSQAILELISQLSNLSEQTPSPTIIAQFEDKLKEITTKVQATTDDEIKLTQDAKDLLNQVKELVDENKSQTKIQQETDKQLQDFNKQMSQLKATLEELQTAKQQSATQMSQITTELQQQKAQKLQDTQNNTELNNQINLLAKQINQIKNKQLQNQMRLKNKKANLKKKMNDLVKKSKQRQVRKK